MAEIEVEVLVELELWLSLLVIAVDDFEDRDLVELEVGLLEL